MKTLFFSFLSIFLSTSVFAESCPKPTLDNQFNLTLPCVGVKGIQYSANLKFVPEIKESLTWKLGKVENSVCDWNVKTCSSVDDNLQLTISSIPLNNEDVTATLALTNLNNLTWHYLEHSPTQTRRGKLDNHGTLLPYEVKKTTNGKGRKLLAIYMVGSNLESGSSQAGTIDLLELIGGYRELTDPNVDVIVAFGGANKSNWQGMKFADMPQLLEDSNDARFGNLDTYLYRSDLANMGDVSSLKHFLNFIHDAYIDYDNRFLVFWDHGASYMGFGNDEYYNMKSLSLPDIKSALTDSKLHFNLLGFDACLMGSLETAKYVHDFADYLLASEETEPGHGWNWTAVMNAYAKYNDSIQVGKAIIDNYVDNNSHTYVSSGKTLSLVNLAFFPKLEAALTPLLELLNSYLAANNAQTIDIIGKVMQEVRGFSNSYRISLDFKDFLTYLDSLNTDPTIKEKVTPLIEALESYLIYAKHDGSRPYAYGATMDRFDNQPYQVNLNNAVSDFQKIWQTKAINDKSAPENFANYRAELSKLNNITSDELTILRNYIDSGKVSLEALVWWEKAYQIMAGNLPSLEEKLKAIAELENQSGGIFKGDVIRKYFLNKVEITRVEIVRGVEITRGVEIIRGVEIVRRNQSNPPSKNTRTEIDFMSKPLDLANHSEMRRQRTIMQQERAAFSVPSNPSTLRSATSATFTGRLDGFKDENPIKVTAVYGTIYYNPETGEAQDFDSFAEMEAFPTNERGTYFTHAWNRMWYTVKYSQDQSSLWLPLRFAEHFSKNGATYTAYTGEILYRDWQASYPTLVETDAVEKKTSICETAGLVYRKGKCFRQAILELHTDSSNNIVAQQVRPYQIVADKPQFDKEAAILKAGDEAWFLFDSFGLKAGSTPVRLANTFSNPVHFTQNPVFNVEMMSAVSGTTLLPKKFYYALRATDIAGNITITPPFLAKTPMPPCAKLTETSKTFQQVQAEIAASKNIIFVSDLGNSLDTAASTLMVAAEAEEKADFLTQVESFYSVLYNRTTFDAQVSDWVWGDKVDWSKAKLGIETILPTLESISQRVCSTNY